MNLTTSSAQKLTYLRALVYGPSGIGKTTSIASLPQDRTLIIASERGLIPLRRHDFPVAQIATWEQFRETFSQLAASRDGDHLVVEGKKITTVVLDSLSEVSEMLKRHIVSVERPKLLNVRTRGKQSAPENIYDDLMDMEAWNLYGTRLRNALACLMQLPCHVICTSLEAMREDKRSGQIWRHPNLNGALAMECAAFFDVVVHMESVDDGEGGNTRIWKTYNDGNLLAKDASAALDMHEPADWSEVMKKIYAKETGK